MAVTLPNVGCTIDATGISAPDYATILDALRTAAQSIYGVDIYIDDDSQDGQQLAVIAKAIDDANKATIATYQAFSPTFAQGVGLSSVVKINGIRRQSASYSTAVGDVVGQAGTIILGGIVRDNNGNRWELPAGVEIPGGGSVTVTVTAIDQGDIQAASGTIDEIVTPTAGWQSFVSTADATPGAPVESDAGLRRRQTVSVGIPARTPLDAMLGALANLSGVTRVRVYENPTGAPDSDGLPAHSISVVIAGGDSEDIATTIGQGKTPGAATYGSTSQAYTDPITEITYTIHYYVLAEQTIQVVVTGTALAGYSSLIAAEIKQAVADYLNGLEIGADVQYTRMYPPAYLNGAANGATYEITGLTIQGSGGPVVVDIVIPFNKAAACDPDTDVTVTIT